MDHEVEGLRYEKQRETRFGDTVLPTGRHESNIIKDTPWDYRGVSRQVHGLSTSDLMIRKLRIGSQATIVPLEFFGSRALTWLPRHLTSLRIHCTVPSNVENNKNHNDK